MVMSNPGDKSCNILRIFTNTVLSSRIKAIKLVECCNLCKKNTNIVIKLLGYIHNIKTSTCHLTNESDHELIINHFKFISK